jgi:hypothetical protein
VGTRLILFTVEEANRLAAEIRPAMERLVRARREYSRVDERATVLALATSGADEANPDRIEHDRLVERRRALGEDIARGVGRIQRRGCVLKDLDRGLVDFYSLAGDRLIFLCWQVDEPEVTHWHPVHGGYADRQPIHRSELEE